MTVALVGAVVCAGFALSAQEPKPAAGAEEKAVDLTDLRDAIEIAAKRGENVDEIRKALAALEKARPAANAGRVPAELQAVRDAVDAAARKGENVEAIAKELEAVEKAVAGRTLVKPRPEPPKPNPEPNPFNRRDPLVPFPVVPFPNNPGGGIDPEAFQKAMDGRMKALELLRKDPKDAEARKLLAEANELMLKSMRPNGGAAMPLFPEFPAFPDVGRVPDRARLGIKLERVTPVVAEQLGLDANVGIAVTSVLPGSAAEKAGLKTHDIILEFAGKVVSDNTEDFIRRVNEAKAGEKIDLVILRKGKKVDVKGVVLPDMGAAPRPAPRRDPALPPIAVDGFDAVNVVATDGAFTVTGTKGAVKYVVTGTLDAAGRPSFGKVVVDGPGMMHTTDQLFKLPAEFQPDVEKLLKGVGPAQK